MTYTTQDLIAILDAELQANWRGERVLLSSGDRLNNLAIAKALGEQQISKVFAYQDFRAQIHAYQQAHQVSGIVWRTCQVGTLSVDLPEIHPQLAAIASDKTILMQAKPAILDFWHQVTQDLQFWWAGHEPRPLSPAALQAQITAAEWVELDVARAEYYLGLCWGQPTEHRQAWARPASGCDRVIAARSEPSATKV